MVMKSSLKFAVVLGLIIISVQCGEKIKLPTSLPYSQDKTLDTTYVQIEPVWDEAGGIHCDRGGRLPHGLLACRA